MPEQINSYLATDNTEVEILEKLPIENKLEGGQKNLDDDLPLEDKQKLLERYSREGLNQKDLAKRFDRDAGTISKRKDRDDFPIWSANRDPDAIAWEYHLDDKKFYPLKEN